jgi:hypothetical protein
MTVQVKALFVILFVKKLKYQDNEFGISVTVYLHFFLYTTSQTNKGKLD